MNKTNELKAGAILSYVNLAISCIIPFLYTPIMLKILGQEEYGVYALSNSVISYLALLTFGMGSAVVRYVSKQRAEGQIEDVRKTFGLFIVIYSVLAIFVCIGGAVLFCSANSLFGKGLTGEELQKFRALLIIMTASMALSFPLGTFSSIVIVYERYIFSKLVGIAETILGPIFSLMLLYVGAGSLGLASLGILFQVLSGVIMGWYCAKKLDIFPVFSNMPFGILKELGVFCAFIFLSGIVDMLYWATDKVLIGAMIGSSAVAVYNIGGTFTSMLQNMAHAISSVFSPRVNILVATNESPQVISELLIRIGRLQYLVVSLILSGYIVFGQKFILLWAGSEYSDAYYVALLTMVPLAVPLIQNIAFTTIVAQNKHSFRSIIYAIIAVANVVSTYLVLPHYGIIGAAVCTAVAFVLGQGIVMNVYYYIVTKLDILGFWKNIGKMSIVPGGMIAVWFGLINSVFTVSSFAYFFAFVVGYTALFVVFSWLLSMNDYEKQLVSGLVQKVLSLGRSN